MIVERDGIEVHIAIAGSGPTVLLLHPIGADGEFWQGVGSRLRPRYRTVTVDFRGHGRSPRSPRPFSLDDLAGDIGTVIDRLGAGSCAVVGLSLGGMVAEILAIDEPAKVSALVLADAHHAISSETATFFERRAQAVEAGGMAALQDVLIERWFSPQFRDANRRVVEVFGRQLRSIDPITHAWTWRALMGLSVESRIGGIEVPTLVVTGSEDVATTPAAGRRLASLLPRGEFAEVPGAGHLSAYEQPAMFAELVDRFVTKHAIWRAPVAGV